MPIRAHCTICSDFFDNERDVAAIHCGHTFHHLCLLQWFDTAPSRTCPQCRIQVGKRHIINKLFFDVALEEHSALDVESVQNELDRVKAQLSMKEKEKRDYQSLVDTLRETLDVRNATIESLQKAASEMEMLCSTLKKQMKYLEQQQEDTKTAKEEARRLRNKLKTMEREYENLKESRKASNDALEKLRKELFSVNHKLQKTDLELENTKEELKSTQTDLRNADKEIMSLKKKIGVLQDTIKVPSLTSEALSRLISESPAPVGLLNPKLHRPAHSDEIDLNATFDVQTPKHQPCKTVAAPAKKIKLDKKLTPLTDISRALKEAVENSSCDTEDEHLEDLLPAFIRNSVLSKRPPMNSMLAPHRNTGIVRTGFDGLGGRTKFIQPSIPAEIRPLTVRSKKGVSRQKVAAVSSGISQTKLDDFLK
ncbi:E3 ubiquitin-protein ligase TRAIP isoform X2 [Tiliqua scincoides]|uniref:E3 ubiquitin-protein ligase TRAIP isoform X2 n=1 Tax=Tiliqua scincoides TaxID=71010 RepID=UPI0034634F9A